MCAVLGNSGQGRYATSLEEAVEMLHEVLATRPR
jgi:hypothetical protein